MTDIGKLVGLLSKKYDKDKSLVLKDLLRVESVFFYGVQVNSCLNNEFTSLNKQFYLSAAGILNKEYKDAYNKGREELYK